MAASTESIVRDRYAEAARADQPELCCPVDYDPRYLEAIPAAVLERDYGCGDPSRHLNPGETVLDLGSGGGKICFIASQVVGPEGQVIGVDVNDEMLALARSAQPEVAKTIGHDNIRFLEGSIDDLALDLGALRTFLEANPATDIESLRTLRAEEARLRELAPLIADESIDVVVSNCVLNLVSDDRKRKLFEEIYRVLRRGGRAVISDIVSDEPIPAHLKADPELWSGCISGAFEEAAFLQAFESAGFHGIEILEAAKTPWRVVEGIIFRSFTVAAYKGKEGPCLDHHEAVIYRGPFREVLDDDGHRFPRGERMAVCRKTFKLLGRAPYHGHFDTIAPPTPVTDPEPFPCGVEGLRRDPKLTKSENLDETSNAADPCGPAGCC